MGTKCMQGLSIAYLKKTLIIVVKATRTLCASLSYPYVDKFTRTNCYLVKKILRELESPHLNIHFFLKIYLFLVTQVCVNRINASRDSDCGKRRIASTAFCA